MHACRKDTNYQPAFHTPIFEQWTGTIPEDCNVLVIDEAHDLTIEDQKKLAQWKKNIKIDNSNKYLLVACDRNQALKRKDTEEDIIAGLNFSGHSTRLNRIYRCPFPVYVASIGLLFRWFAPKGGGVQLSTQKLREHFGFKPNVQESEDKIQLAMRNDCHPGNNWRQTVGFFQNATIAASHLSLYNFERKQVLWARFQKTDPEFDYTDIQREYTFVDLIAPDSSNEVDLYIKGQEFAIVVVEGLPANMNPKDLSETDDWGKSISEAERRMWEIRRSIYVVCSRASAFLYFIKDLSRYSGIDSHELRKLIEQVSRPERKRNESGQTWKFEVIKPKTKRNPLIFKDVEDKVISPTIIKIISVPTLSSSMNTRDKEIQSLLPDSAKAKHDIEKTIKPQDAAVIADKLGFELKPYQNKYWQISQKEKGLNGHSSINAKGLSKPQIVKPEDISKINFESNLGTRLKHIYGVLFFMKKDYDFPSAVKETLKLFTEVKDYNTISDKCARGFAESVNTFVEWFNTGETLNRLLTKFKLSDNDYNIFKHLLK